ncbi:MAG: hypothetical protein O2917_06705, partial [Acidobacteria bacterium]|nr:hypothetical protein [Acidobacteriota bacterium]
MTRMSTFGRMAVAVAGLTTAVWIAPQAQGQPGGKLSPVDSHSNVAPTPCRSNRSRRPWTFDEMIFHHEGREGREAERVEPQ